MTPNEIQTFARAQTLKLDFKLNKSGHDELSVREMAIFQMLIELVCETFGEPESITTGGDSNG